jgi:APA family basic amino acid/polyamine antiporter
VGIIIGAGIYVLLGTATQQAGAAVWLAFLVAGTLSAFTALSYAELAAMFPNAGAEYDYTRRVAPPWVAFLIGWLMILGLIVAAATVSLGFGRYVTYFVDVSPRLSGFALLALVTAVALSGIQQSARLTVALSLIQVGGLLCIVAIGVPHVGEQNLLEGGSAAGVMSAAALVFFAFVGFDEVITLAEETTDPVRTVPRALLAALAISTALYAGVAIAAVSVLGPAALADSRQPLADVMAVAIGSRGATVMAVVALVATTNTTLMCVTAASRLQYGMAATGALPARLTQLNRRGAPWIALGLSAVIAGGFAAIDDLSLIAGVTDASIYLVFVAVNLTVILLRFRQPRRRRPFRVPWAIARVPVPPILALAAIAVLLPSLHIDALAIGAGVIVVGIGVYFVLRRVPRPVPTVHFPTDDAMPRRTRVSADEAARVAAALRIDLDAVDFDLEQLRSGMQVELQHGTADPDTNVTDDDLVATAKIALAHLHEIPDYYTRLAAMEEAARRER